MKGGARQALILIAWLKVWLEVLGFWALAVLFAAALTFKGLRRALRSGSRAPLAGMVTIIGLIIMVVLGRFEQEILESHAEKKVRRDESKKKPED